MTIEALPLDADVVPAVLAQSIDCDLFLSGQLLRVKRLLIARLGVLRLGERHRCDVDRRKVLKSKLAHQSLSQKC